MADVQAEHGFVMIALDLFAALMVADLPNRCMIVLTEHLAASYGPVKHRQVFLDPATIEDHSGMHRNNARRAIKELVAANILQPEPSGSFKFNKDYESWKPGGQPLSTRLGGGPVKFAKWTKNRYGIQGNKSVKATIQPDSPPIPLDCGQTDCLNPAGLRLPSPTESNGIGQIIDTCDANQINEETCGLAGAHAREEKENLEDVVAVADASVPSISRLEREVIPFEFRRPFKPSDAEVDRVAKWAESLGVQGETLSIKVREFKSSYPLEWIEDAIICGIAGAAPGRAWSYATKCLLAWYSRGQPDHTEIKQARGSFPANDSPRKPTASEKAKASREALKRVIADIPEVEDY